MRGKLYKQLQVTFNIHPKPPWRNYAVFALMKKSALNNTIYIKTAKRGQDSYSVLKLTMQKSNFEILTEITPKIVSNCC